MARLLTRRSFLFSAALLPALHPWHGHWHGAETKSRSGRPAEVTPVNFRKLRLLANRLDEMRSFYRNTLQLPVRESGDSLAVAAGSTLLEFQQGAEGSLPNYHFAFNIPENKVEQAHRWASARCPLIHHWETRETLIHFRPWNAHSIYFPDPSGNLVEFIARHDLDNARTGAFGPEDIFYASEIGVVVDSVPETVSFLNGALGLSPYRPPISSFAAVGEEHGMFIVVEKERLWYPARKVPAAVFPSEIHLRGARREELQMSGCRTTLHLQP